MFGNYRNSRKDHTYVKEAYSGIKGMFEHRRYTDEFRSPNRLPNPLMGNQRENRNQNRIKANYSKYIKEVIKNIRRQRSKQLSDRNRLLKANKPRIRNVAMNNILTTNSNKKFTNMTKVEQKLTRTLDFSDKEFKTPDLTTKIRKNLDVSLGYSNERGILGQMHSHRSSGSSRSGSKRSLRNSYELRSHSPIERKKDTEEYYITLKSQISEKEKQAKEQKEMKKLEDAEYLGLMINHFPFGKMGAGAPLRDKNGHILAERGHMSDKDTNETPVLYSPKEAYNSFSHQKQPDKSCKLLLIFS
ncbi:unnamed protein product [Moneuplotes crassus]|uniref:Uncharacterized protein n=1 Tax=Euplotes crassus TaxID=5936 RepID=A0AAD1UGK2_EUPCR|nr:unnamed protein product [Moneuplotes crassus]